MNGLRKMAPKQVPVKRPILKSDLRGVKAVIKLNDSHPDRTLWELLLKKWQVGMRSADIIKRRCEVRKDWNPQTNTHRGRLRIEMMKDKKGNNEEVKLVLVQKQSKNVAAGESGFEKGFIIDRNPEALSAGKALWDVLSMDPDTEELESTPVFSDQTTGNEIYYEESKSSLMKALHEAGIDLDGFSTHSLRVVADTAYAN